MPAAARRGAIGAAGTRTSWLIMKPQAGQPSPNTAAFPSKPHFGQRTAVKLLPQKGHTPAFELTSREQFPQ